MLIYSRSLGVGDSHAVGFSPVYVSPVGEGPTILKGVSLQMSPGARGGIFLYDGASFPPLAYLDASTSAVMVAEFFPVWQVLEPGSEIRAYNFTSIAMAWWVSGQHFLTP